MAGYRIMKKYFIVLAAFTLFSCTVEKPLPSGYELLERDNKEGLKEPVVLEPIEIAHYWQRSATGGYDYLVLGKHHNVTASILLNANTISNLDTTAVVSASFNIYQKYVYKGDTPFNVTVHRVTQEWDEQTVQYKDVQDYIEQDPVETFQINPQDTTWFSHSFQNKTFVQEWINDARSENPNIYGLVFKTETNDHAVEFLSSDASSGLPSFQFILKTAEGTNDTTTIPVSHDASLLHFESDQAEYDIVKMPPTFRVGNGSGYRTLMRFDLSELPEEAAVHQALLTLYVDNEKSSTNVAKGLSIAPQAVVGEGVEDSLWTSGRTVLKDSLRRTTSAPAFDQTATFSFSDKTPLNAVSGIVQRWANRVTPNYGLILYPINAGRDFQEMYFHSGTQNPELTPTLKITYSLPPKHRFSGQ